MDFNYIFLFFIVFLLLDLFIIVFVFKKKRSLKPSAAQVQFVLKKWHEIQLMFSEDPVKAILNADKLLDKALTYRGVNFRSLGEKLKVSSSIFSNIDNVWKAHKMRNKLAHDFVDFKNDEYKRSLMYFKQALRDLGYKI